jgi:hypothetical protein
LNYQGDKLSGLLRSAVEYYDDHAPWVPGKKLIVPFLRHAADDPKVAEEFGQRRYLVASTRGEFGDSPAPAPTLADLVKLVFDTALVIYAAELPFGGYWVRAVRDFVLQYIELIVPVVPTGLRYSAVR